MGFSRFRAQGFSDFSGLGFRVRDFEGLELRAFRILRLGFRARDVRGLELTNAPRVGARAGGAAKLRGSWEDESPRFAAAAGLKIEARAKNGIPKPFTSRSARRARRSAQAEAAAQVVRHGRRFKVEALLLQAGRPTCERARFSEPELQAGSKGARAPLEVEHESVGLTVAARAKLNC